MLLLLASGLRVLLRLLMLTMNHEQITLSSDGSLQATMLRYIRIPALLLT